MRAGTTASSGTGGRPACRVVRQAFLGPWPAPAPSDRPPTPFRCFSQKVLSDCPHLCPVRPFATCCRAPERARADAPSSSTFRPSTHPFATSPRSSPLRALAGRPPERPSHSLSKPLLHLRFPPSAPCPPPPPLPRPTATRPPRRRRHRRRRPARPPSRPSRPSRAPTSDGSSCPSTSASSPRSLRPPVVSMSEGVGVGARGPGGRARSAGSSCAGLQEQSSELLPAQPSISTSPGIGKAPATAAPAVLSRSGRSSCRFSLPSPSQAGALETAPVDGVLGGFFPPPSTGPSSRAHARALSPFRPRPRPCLLAESVR